MPDLRTAVVVDYQNVHLVGHGLYDSTRLLARHATLIDPLLFANHLLLERNAAQRIGMAAAVLSRVEVFRGQPSPEARLRWLLAPAGTEGPMGGYLIDVILTRDPWMHRTDIAEATGAPLVLTAEHDGILVDDVVKEWAARHGSPAPLSSPARPADPGPSARAVPGCRPTPCSSAAACQDVAPRRDS